MIRFVCECGKQLQVRDEHAGKRVTCPACQRQVTVPEEPLPVEAVQASRPLRRDEDDWDEEEEIEERPRREQSSGASRKAVASLVLGILSLFCNVLASVPALILAILAFREISRSRGRLSGQGLAIAGIVTACVCTLLSCGIVIPITSMSVGLFLPAFQKVREAAGRVQSQNNLRQLALGMLNYQAANNGRFPSSAICDKTGKPLLSWRVAILPYIEQEHLYKQFKLDEPWDGPNNKRLLSQMPLVYRVPSEGTQASDTTHYQVFVGNGAAFDKTRGSTIRDFTDGMSNTILIVEAPTLPVPWTKPDDIDFNPNKPIKGGLGIPGGGGCSVAMADGSVRWVKPQVSENTLKAAITRNGRDALGPDW
jgi:hypothetical protein